MVEYSIVSASLSGVGVLAGVGVERLGGRACGGHIDGPPGTSATVYDAVQEAAMEASRPAR